MYKKKVGGSLYGAATPFKSANRINVLTREYHFQNGLIKHSPKSPKKHTYIYKTYKKGKKGNGAGFYEVLSGSCNRIRHGMWNSYSFDFTMRSKVKPSRAGGSRQAGMQGGTSTKCALPKTDTHLF